MDNYIVYNDYKDLLSKVDDKPACIFGTVKSNIAALKRGWIDVDTLMKEVKELEAAYLAVCEKDKDGICRK